MKKERIFYLDFIRGIAVLLVMVYHYNITVLINGINVSKKIFIGSNMNISIYGFLGILLYFIISGAALMHVYGNKDFSVKKFFKRRFVAIYPMYWVAFTIAFLYLFYLNRTINEAIPKFSIILTIFGIDGFMLPLGPNYYILGEWFLGCIIFIYILFPVLRKYVIEKPKILLATVCVLYVILSLVYILPIPIDHFFLFRIPDFLFGMYFVRYVKNVKIPLLISALIMLVIIYIFSGSINQMYMITLGGPAVFIVLVFISQFINFGFVQKVCIVISNYSFAVILVHHVILDQLIKRFIGVDLSGVENYLLFFLYCLITGIFSYLLYHLNNRVIKIFNRQKI